MKQRIWTYNHRATVHFGPGALGRLPELVKGCAPDARIMLVTGRGAMRKTGVLDRVLNMLGADRVTVFDRVPPNPDTELVHQGVNLYRHEQCGMIVALGGGSAMDAAKAIGLMARHQGDLSEYMLQERAFTPQCDPIITVNTTAGTGSEVNASFVITVPGKQNKYGLAVDAAWPRHAIVDPELCRALPPDQTASTGLDALSHAFEAFWCARRQPASDVHAFEAIPIILKWLPRAVDKGDDMEARTWMSFAALQAGFALCSTGTAMAHGMSYPLSARWGVPHGFACLFVLPEVLEFNFPTFSHQRKRRLLQAMGAADEAQAVLTLRDFSRRMGTPGTLQDFKIYEDKVPLLTTLVNPFNLKNNLRPVSTADLEKIWTRKL